MARSSLEMTTAQPNLTPLLDMVFQLITFFMLVINFKDAALDQSLTLPVLGSARPLDTKGQEDLLVLNIDAEGQLKVYGVVRDVKIYIADEARQEEARLKTKGTPLKPGEELPTMVVIRADRATRFNLLNEIIKTCQQHNYRKFALKAMNRREGP
ncbi:MAG TPA: biopolymer transporter ExbD [Planctomycetaceae bacterium]|jgi:biopolymer transport protein ExbD|nr:biopolymer transporter ExbD [Planctomycetaceae bacterium]